MRMSVIKGFRSIEIGPWATKDLQDISVVISDGLACLTAVCKASCLHCSVVTVGRPELLVHKAFKRVNIMISNVKNSLRGSCHSVSRKHFPRYLAEMCFCFNHRLDLQKMLPAHGKMAMFTRPVLYRLLTLAESLG